MDRPFAIFDLDTFLAKAKIYLKIFSQASCLHEDKRNEAEELTRLSINDLEQF